MRPVLLILMASLPFSIPEFLVDKAEAAPPKAASVPPKAPAPAPKPPPSITDINVPNDAALGVLNGKVAEPVGATYNGSLPINDVAHKYPWTISGKNFGPALGAVFIGDTNLTARIPKGGWTNTAITVDLICKDLFPNQPYDWGALSVNVTVVTADNLKTPSKAFQAVPAVEGLIYTQCTWWAGKVRKQAQKTIGTYADHQAITANWVPQGLDRLKWEWVAKDSKGNPYTARHAALIESVKQEKDGSYTLTITQYNAKADNQFSRYSTSFVPKGKDGKVVFPQSSFPAKGPTLDAAGYYR